MSRCLLPSLVQLTVLPDTELNIFSHSAAGSSSSSSSSSSNDRGTMPEGSLWDAVTDILVEIYQDCLNSLVFSMAVELMQ